MEKAPDIVMVRLPCCEPSIEINGIRYVVGRKESEKKDSRSQGHSKSLIDSEVLLRAGPYQSEVYETVRKQMLRQEGRPCLAIIYAISKCQGIANRHDFRP